jgi:hypothetical protein
MSRDQLSPRTEPRQPIPDRLGRPVQLLSDPAITRAGRGQQHRRADHLDRVTAPKQTHVRQQHVRRPARRLPAAPPTWPQPPHPIQTPHRPPPSASPPAQNPQPAPRAHQPARGDIRLQARAIVCDDEQDRPSFRGINGPPRHTRQGPSEGAQRQHDDHHHVVGHPARPGPITTQRVADSPRRHHPACRSTNRRLEGSIRWM